jgi:hypothetical protein
MNNYYQSKGFSTTIINCPYINQCINANSFMCCTCRHNKGKKDYYSPEPYKPPQWPRDPWSINCNSPRFD